MIILRIFAVIGMFCFTTLITTAMFSMIGIPSLSLLLAVPLGIGGAVWVWRCFHQGFTGIVATVGYGAALCGGIGFIGGFFGPLLLTPGANQGPLLGIFITGPLGVLVGAMGGAVWWYIQQRRTD